MAHRVIHAAGRPWQQMLRSCLDQLDGAAGDRLGLLFVADPTSEMVDSVVRGLRERTGIERWVGAAGRAILAGSREIGGEGGLAVMTLDLPEHAFRLFDLAAPQTVTGSAAAGLVHAPADLAVEPGHLASIAGPTGALLYGGRGASQYESGQIAGGPAAGSLTGVLFSSEVAVAAGLCQSYRSLGPAHEVTGAIEGRLIGLDGRPALETLMAEAGELFARAPQRLTSQIQIADADAAGAAGEADADLGAAVHAILAIDRAGGTLDIDAARLGRRVRFVRREPARAMADLERLARNLRQQLGGREPRVAIYYASARRGAELFGPGVEEAATLQDVLGPVPLIGLRTEEEIFGAGVRRFSGVLCLIA